MHPTLVCLHGWGGSAESFTELRDALRDAPINILTPDLPGFGKEPEPETPWNTDDYADWVASYIRTHVSGQYTLLGHSHGGRIALKMLGRPSHPNHPTIEKPTHLFLCAAAGIRHPRHVKRIIGLTLAKTGRFFLAIPGLTRLAPVAKKLLYRLVRVHDYERASPIMRQTMINVATEDLRPLLPRIHVPTDLFWGRDDGMTPFADALVMERKIRHATLHAYEGVRHRVHRDRAAEIAAVIRKRIPLQ